MKCKVAFWRQKLKIVRIELGLETKLPSWTQSEVFCSLGVAAGRRRCASAHRQWRGEGFDSTAMWYLPNCLLPRGRRRLPGGFIGFVLANWTRSQTQIQSTPSYLFVWLVLANTCLEKRGRKACAGLHLMAGFFHWSAGCTACAKVCGVLAGR